MANRIALRFGKPRPMGPGLCSLTVEMMLMEWKSSRNNDERWSRYSQLLMSTFTFPFSYISTTTGLRKMWCKEFFIFARVRFTVSGGRTFLVNLMRRSQVFLKSLCRMDTPVTCLQSRLHIHELQYGFTGWSGSIICHSIDVHLPSTMAG